MRPPPPPPPLDGWTRCWQIWRQVEPAPTPLYNSSNSSPATPPPTPAPASSSPPPTTSSSSRPCSPASSTSNSNNKSKARPQDTQNQSVTSKCNDAKSSFAVDNFYWIKIFLKWNPFVRHFVSKIQKLNQQFTKVLRSRSRAFWLGPEPNIWSSFDSGSYFLNKT